MPAAITTTLRRVLHAIREFTVGQRTVAIIGLGVLIVGAVGLTAWLGQPNYSPLFTSLSATDASSITQLLHTDNVPYELADGGATLLVPQGQVDAERLKAASAGLPSLSQNGYGLLDKLGVTASQFQETTTWQRALEGELATTIEGMSGVQTASVKLAIPTQSVFSAQQAPTTASVFLKTQGGTVLTPSQVLAITHLTAASVDNLTPANVSVISADGSLLSATAANPADTANGQATSYEAHVQSAVQTMLDRVVGVGNSTVVVAADLSAESANRVSQTYSVPTNAPAINEQLNSQIYNGTGGTGAAGVLGPDNVAVPTGTSTNGSYKSLQSTKNNAIDQTTETRTIPAGAVNRETVSVAVNTNAVKGISAAAIRALVDAAAGVNVTRGDMVDVQLVAFSKAGAGAAAAALQDQSGREFQSSLIGIGTTVVIVLGVLLGIFLLLRFLAKLGARSEELPFDLGPLAATPILPDHRELDFAGHGLLAPSEVPPPALPSFTGPDSLGGPGSLSSPGPLEVDRMRANIDRLAASDPQRTAEHLRALMDEKQLT